MTNSFYLRSFCLSIAVAPFLLITACKKLKADDAFFLDTKSVSVATVPTEGSTSNKITDLWLYTNGKFQGAYPVGSIIPIVTKGENVKINLFAGIKNNGISGTRLSYIFYQYLTIDTFVEKGKIVGRPLTFSYVPSANFAWIEDFDGNGISLINSTVSQSTLEIAPTSESLEHQSGLLALTGNSTVAQVESSIPYSLPTGNSNIYLEFDYKCNQDFEVGLIGGTELKQALFVTAKNDWNKIYVQMSNAISSGNVYPSYKVYFKMNKRTDNPKLFLDNIKLIHF